jgi:hypothetical protein
MQGSSRGRPNDRMDCDTNDPHRLCDYLADSVMDRVGDRAAPLSVHLLSHPCNAKQSRYHLNSPKPCFPYKSKTYEHRKQGSETEEYPGWDEVIGA